jgi:hypothetical protein
MVSSTMAQIQSWVDRGTPQGARTSPSWVVERAHEFGECRRMARSRRSNWFLLYAALSSAACFAACGDDDESGAPAAGKKSQAGGRSAAGSGGTEETSDGEGGSSGGGGASGRGTRASALNCGQRPDEEVVCGDETCATESEHENNSCFVPCCYQLDGKDHCGFRGTSRAFTTDCLPPAVADDSCDQTPQFRGCCDVLTHKCGIIGGFSPGCTLETSFVTLPAEPKSCGMGDQDAGASD